MNVTCPFCKEALEARSDGVRCAECATPHHEACWGEAGGRCTTLGCGSEEHRPFTRRAAGRIVLKAGRRAVGHAVKRAHERLGASSLLILFLLTLLLTLSAVRSRAVSISLPLLLEALPLPKLS